MRHSFLLSMLILICCARQEGQRIGSCPPAAQRKPQGVKELKSVIIDENLAIIPKVKVQLQERNGDSFRDLEIVETDSSGRFNFERSNWNNYRLAITRFGFCPAMIPLNHSKLGFKGIRLTLPIAASDTCPEYCEKRLKIGKMTGREGRE